jgi:integrase
MISDCAIGQVVASQLSALDVVNFCRDRREAGAGPATVAVDVSNLRAVLKLAKAVYGVDADEKPLVEAHHSLRALGLIGKPERRTRRPTADELERMREGLAQRAAHKNASIPFVEILDFSVLSCMRVGEVCAILWDDLDHDQQAVMVRDRKDPRRKAGNHMMVPLLGGAWDIALAQPRTDDPRIFPYEPTSVSAGFQRIRVSLGIKDLRYHDLRREGASRLFEAGYSIDEVAQVTGHRDINTLWQIYTNLNPSRLTRRP